MINLDLKTLAKINSDSKMFYNKCYNKNLEEFL